MELSFSEILLILVIALLVMGPKDIVKTATQLGRWAAKVRTQIHNFKIMLAEEVLQEEKNTLQETKQKLVQSVADLKKEVEVKATKTTEAEASHNG